MNKAIRIFLVLGVVCSLLGIGAITAGAMMGGVLELGPYLNIGSSKYGAAEQNISGTINSLEESQNETEEFLGVKKLELEVGPGNVVEIVEIQRDDPLDNTIGILRGEGTGRSYLVEQRGEELEISYPKLFAREGMEALTIFVPAGHTLKDLEITVSAGEFFAEQIHTERLSLESNVGQIQIQGGAVGNLEIDCRAGEIRCFASSKQDVEVDCAAGNVEVLLSGQKQDYNYELECKTGSIVLDGTPRDQYEGVITKKQIHNNANCNVELDCSAGTILVSYQEIM